MIISGITIGSGVRFSVPPSADVVGQAQFITPGTFTWTAPSGVTSVCVVCVGAGGGGYRGTSAGVVTSGGNTYFISDSTVAGFGGLKGGAMSGTSGTIRPGYGAGGGYVGDGGGFGGNSYTGSGSNFYGGGGAGGYSGNGGDGGLGTAAPTVTIAGGDGQGGGGGGGAWGQGGGVGIYGQGTNGNGSPVTSTVNGTGYARGGSFGGNGVQYPNGSGTQGFRGGAYGGGGGGTYTINGGGGGLGWKNNIPVTPGQSYTVVVGAGGNTDGPNFSGNGGNGAARIIWGAGRAYPSTLTGNL